VSDGVGSSFLASLKRTILGHRRLPLIFTGDGPHEVAGFDLLHGAGMLSSSKMST